MQIAIIGMGRMGANMARRLIGGHHEVFVYNRTHEKAKKLVSEGAIHIKKLENIVKEMKTPRTVLIMLPAGWPVDEHIEKLKGILSKGDIIIDGGNSYYKDDLRRAGDLSPAGIHYMDLGISGGIWGLKEGYCTMAGGEKSDYEHVEPLLKTLAPKHGYLHCGPHGAGHFVKMVHNGIEYAMMESYGEGFEILEASPYSEHLNMEDIAHLWNQGSVIRSWLLELVEAAFNKDPKLKHVAGYVDDSGEGRWMVEQAIESNVDATTIAHALFKRFASRKKDIYSNKLLAALRKEFGGHPIKKA